MPGFEGSPGLTEIIDFATKEIKTLEQAGFDGILVENEGDRPHPLIVSSEYLGNFSKLIRALKTTTKIPLGLEILYDMVGTVKVGIEAKADFVRLDVFTDPTETRWGIVPECVTEVTKLRADNPEHFPLLFTDVHVKHGKNLSGRTLSESGKLAIINGANSLIVTSHQTGTAPTLEDSEILQEVSAGAPLFVGSGFAIDNIEETIKYCQGAVVATSIMTGDLFDLAKAQALTKKVRQLTGKI